MQAITMTPEQTEIYDQDGAEAVELMRTLTKKAQELADDTGQTCEIYTADGIVAEVRYPEAV